MTFKEYDLAIRRNPVLGMLLPLECRRTYPRLELDGTTLCASFIGFRTRPVQGGIEAQAPAYFLKITYPQCAIRAFVKFTGNDPDWHLMTPRTPEAIRSLAESCDDVLACFEENRYGLAQALMDYNDLLERMLEPEQFALLEKMSLLDAKEGFIWTGSV